MIKLLKSLITGAAGAKVAVVPDGWCLVREKPTEAHIESMCMRFDHSHGIKHQFPVEESDAHFEARRRFNRTMVLQLYEEAVGLGFHKIDTAEEQKEGGNMLEMFTDQDWMRADDFRMMADGIKFAGHSKVVEPKKCDWVSAKNSIVQSGSVCLSCNAIDSREPEQINACAKGLACTTAADSQGAVND